MLSPEQTLNKWIQNAYINIFAMLIVENNIPESQHLHSNIDVYKNLIFS